MSDLVAPPDVEGMIVAYLKPLLADARVSTRYPATGDGLVVRVTAAGGDVTGLVNAEQRVIVECWAGTSTAAHDLAARAHAHLTAWTDVYRCAANLPVSHPDVDRPTLSRYQFLATVWSRMKELS